uniref:Uncharacterized protein n=1 Tax=viral metagenome TaxID=1070528 RepID=A0A6H1ZU65_9ZZZZ
MGLAMLEIESVPAALRLEVGRSLLLVTCPYCGALNMLEGRDRECHQCHRTIPEPDPCVVTVLGAVTKGGVINYKPAEAT